MKKINLWIGVALFCATGIAQAQTFKMPSSWFYGFSCASPAPGGAYFARIYGGSKNCAQTVQAIANAAQNCNAGTVVTTSDPTCSAPANRQLIDTISPGGTHQQSGQMFPYCNDGGVQSDPANGLYCLTSLYANVLNAGVPRSGCEGNPCNPSNGSKLEIATDYVGAGPFPLKFERYFNSLIFDTSAGMGASWTHTYHRNLLFDPASSLNFIGAMRPDGKNIPFNRSAGVYQTFAGQVVKLVQISGGWQLTNADDEIELYDSQGNLTSITDRNGRAQTLAYDASGLLASVTDPFGRTLTFTRNLAGQITSIGLPGGLTLGYTYSTGPGSMYLLQVTFADGRTRQYQYDPNIEDALTGIVDENGQQYASFAYNISTGRIVTDQHAGGAGLVTLVSDQGGGNRNASVTRWVSATQSATRTYTYTSVQGLALRIGITGPACPTCGDQANTYDANGNMASRTDWNGNNGYFAYDLTRNLETARAEGYLGAATVTPQLRAFGTQWHPNFRLVQKASAPLRQTTYVYNGDGGTSCGFMADGVTLVPGVLCTKTIQATTDSNGFLGLGATLTGSPRTWSYTYNANGQVLTMDGPRTDVADTTTYTYYANNDADLGKRGNVASITNAAGQTTQITAYNAHGQPLTIVDPNGLTTTLSYDTRQRLTSRSVGSELTTYSYDPAGQLIQVTLPDSSFLTYSYDLAHRLIGIQDNLGNHIAYTLDYAGNRTQEQVFDPSNALAQTRSRVISNINRLFQELGASSQTTQYAYDNQGNVTSVTDPLNRITANQYDPLNRLKQVTDPNSGVTLYGYNGQDALTQVTDPRNLVTGYTVDGLGNLTQQASPDTGNTANTYDLAGNLLTQTDAKAQVTTYTYDALNRVTSITFNDTSKQTYAYDQGANGLGRLSSITETNPAAVVTSVISYAYDQHGRVTSETRTVNGVAYVLAYTYDSSGRLTGLTYPSGRTVTYTLDTLGRVSQVTTTKDSQSQVVLQNVVYHPFGGAKSWTLGNGQIYSRTVDQDGRIASYTLGATTNTITFDAASRITGIAANTYGYDNLDRLTSAVLPSSNFAYGYDAVGNRLTKTTGANTDTYTYSATSNQIATLTPAAGSPRSFVLDANGSTTNDALNTYAYDTRGRMVQAVNGAGTTSYQVNALGQRIRKTNTNDDRVFVYDTWGKLIAESDPGSGGAKREYVYLGDIPVAVLQ